LFHHCSSPPSSFCLISDTPALPLLTPALPSCLVSLLLLFSGNYVALLGNILFPLIAFGGLFFLFRRAQGGSGGGGPMGPMGGPMEFGRSKSKFQEVPETGVTFADVAVSVMLQALCHKYTSHEQLFGYKGSLALHCNQNAWQQFALPCMLLPADCPQLNLPLHVQQESHAQHIFIFHAAAAGL
jgi:hypothetical protein